MEKLDFYRRTVQDVLTEVAAIPYSNPVIIHEAVIDTVNDRYLAYVDIRGDKIWIQRDGTEAGTPKSDIVLAFHSESVRPYTGYAVA